MQNDPGLDLGRLRALRGRSIDLDALHACIAHYARSHPGRVWVAWSSGKDSTVVLDLARQLIPQIPVVFYDCGLDFPETYRYIDDLAERWSLNLHTIPTRPDLLTAVVAAGDLHRDRPTRSLGVDMRQAMITAPAARAHEQFGPANLWGVRSAESSGRRYLHRRALSAGQPGTIDRVDGTHSYSPIWNWSTPRVWEYLHAHHVPVNPLYTKLAALGVDESHSRVDAMIDPGCLDNGHIAVLARGWPDIFDALVEVLPRLGDYI